MKKMALVLLLLILLSACGAVPPASLPQPTVTPDPCARENLPAEVEKVNKFMREFDDASFLASNTPRAQLPDVITNMQNIHRAAEDQVVPSCLSNLKQLEITHMDTAINTLVVFLGGADQTTLSQGSELARQQHNQYALEYARLLGLTVVAPVTVTAAAQAQDTPQPTALFAFNPGPANVDIYATPELNAPIILILPAGQSLPVVSQSADGQWVQVAIPGQPDQAAWVSAALVTLNPIGTP